MMSVAWLAHERAHPMSPRPAPDAGDGASHCANSNARGDLRALAVVLLIGAVLRFALAYEFEGRRPVIEDAKDYHRLAIGLLETGGYTGPGGSPTSLRPPLYPAVVASLYYAFGRDNFFAVWIFQSAVSLATCAITYVLGRVAYSSRVGLAAATAMCFYPSLLAYNLLLLSEVLFTFFVAAGALFSVLALKEARLRYAAILGLCLGLGALTRSVLWLFAPLLCAALMIFASASRGRRFACASLAIAVFALCLAPWAYRNTKLQKTLTFVDVMGGRNVMMGNYEYTPLDRSWATIEIATGPRAWHQVLAAQTDGYGQLTQGQIDKAAMRYGVHYFFTHPWISLQRSVVKFFNFWQLERELIAGLRQGLFLPVPSSAWLPAALFICGYYAISVFTAIFGALIAPPNDRRVHAVLLAWIAFPCALHAVAFAHSRYHLPLVPILLVYSAAALTNGRAMLACRRSPAFAVACVACCVLIAAWVREFIMVDLRWFV